MAAQLDRFRKHRQNLADEGRLRQLREPSAGSTIWPVDMKKPNVRGPSPARKAHLVLREKLNRKSKPVPAWPIRSCVEKPRLRASPRRSVYGKD